MAVNTPPTSKYSDYQYLLAYVTIFIILYMISKTKIGYNTIYYMLVLLAFTLVLLNVKWLADTLAPINAPSPP